MEPHENKKIVHSSFWTNFFNSPAEKIDLKKSLHSIPLFHDLHKKDISALMKILHHRTYSANEYIFYQGDPGLGLYIIRDGEVTIQRSSDSGDIVSLATFYKGDFFGELALVDGEKRSASAIAKTDVRLAVMFKPDLDEFIDKFPKKGIKILHGISNIIASRLRKLNEEHINLQSKLKMETKHGTEY